MARRNQWCSFCGKREDEVAVLVRSGDKAAICNECVKAAQKFIDAEKLRRSLPSGVLEPSNTNT